MRNMDGYRPNPLHKTEQKSDVLEACFFPWTADAHGSGDNPEPTLEMAEAWRTSCSRNLHFKVHKVLRLQRNLHIQIHIV